jgi:hypothetical protein
VRADASRLVSAAPGAQAAAFAEGLAPALRPPTRVTAVVTAERGPYYLTILYGLLLYRRDHELEPLHEDVAGRVMAPAAIHGPYDVEQLHHDLAQLIEWGAVETITEPHKLRSYKDNRRDRFRYRLTDDAVALLEWLEARLAARLRTRVGDNRDRLTDVAAASRELTRVLDRWREQPEDADTARRALHLVERVGDTLDQVAGELIDLRADMLGFAARPYDLPHLRTILDWLERYVLRYAQRIEALRGDLVAALERLAQPRYREALAACQRRVAADHEALVAVRGGGAVTDASERMVAHAGFFTAAGPLARMTGLVETSARAVVVKMRRHLRELERRSTRLADLRHAMTTIAAGPERDPRRAAWLASLLASAQLRVDARPASATARQTPPAPRGAIRRDRGQAPPPLARKRGTVDAARELATRRAAILASWIDRVVGARPSVTLAALATAELATADGPRQWLAVARSAHLDGGRPMTRAGARLILDSGEVKLGDGRVNLAAPASTLERERRP